MRIYDRQVGREAREDYVKLSRDNNAYGRNDRKGKKSPNEPQALMLPVGKRPAIVKNEIAGSGDDAGDSGGYPASSETHSQEKRHRGQIDRDPTAAHDAVLQHAGIKERLLFGPEQQFVHGSIS
jgi:hypothetical protein